MEARARARPGSLLRISGGGGRQGDRWRRRPEPGAALGTPGGRRPSPRCSWRLGSAQDLAETRGGEPLDAVAPQGRAVAAASEALAEPGSERARVASRHAGSAAPGARRRTQHGEIPLPARPRPTHCLRRMSRFRKPRRFPSPRPLRPLHPPRDPQPDYPTRPQASARPRLLPATPRRLPASAGRLRRRWRLIRAGMRARLAMIAAAGSLALAAAPGGARRSDPDSRRPTRGTFTARVGQTRLPGRVDGRQPPDPRAAWTSTSPGAATLRLRGMPHPDRDDRGP